MKMLLKLLVASFVCCLLSVGVFAQTELEVLEKKWNECATKFDWSCVIETSTKLIKLDPAEAGYVARRGQAYFELNKFDEAQFDLSLASTIVGKNVPLYQYINGRISVAKGDRKSATSFFTGAASIPNDPNHKVFQTALEMAQDSTKTDQDLREKYSSNVCQLAYQNEKKVAAEGISMPSYYIIRNEFEKLKLILPCKLDLSKKEKDGVTSLFIATQNSDPRFITELLKYGADPNFAATKLELTPLMLSVAGENERIENVKILLANGASPFAQTINKEDAIDFAKNKGYTASAALILNAIDARKPISLLEVQERASFYFRHHEFAKAIPDLSAALKLSPANPQIIYARGVCYRFAKKFDLAIADFTELIKTSPNSANLFYVRGVSYLESGNKPAAETDFAKAIELDPKFAGEIEKDRVRVAGNK